MIPREESMLTDSALSGPQFTSVTGDLPAETINELRAHRPHHLAVVIKNRTNPAWVSAAKAADDAAARFGLRITILAPTVPDDHDEQSGLVDDAMRAGDLDGIVFAPADYRRQVDLVERMNAAGLPVYNIGSRVAGGEIVTYVGGDDYTIGRQIVQWLGQHRDKPIRAVIIEGIRAGITGQDRMRGIGDELEIHPEMTGLAAESANYDRGQARHITTQMLRDAPGLNTIVALNDEMAIGAIDALEAAGRLADVTVVGVNGTPDGLRALQRGALSATFDYAVYEMTELTMELAVRHLNGERLERQEIILPAPVIDASNLERALARRRAWGIMD
jgi:ribose transport system substrate-binding protein